ncbi:Protein Dr1-like protein [Zea mays]|uniref:Protein Dr1-like protein n=1 Tax=Zea mays TaxID=4577 RepID=A0A1D6KQ24_MAIZE|nr:Protein Dr1-like protein [Zea mays]ONM04868.1 Protein Dr1-like protein [Zea mays]ONM04872.1 Protein Dr1-like protein [Zea mays]
MEPPNQRRQNKSRHSNHKHNPNFSCILNHSNPCNLKCSCIRQHSIPSNLKCSCTPSHNSSHKCRCTLRRSCTLSHSSPKCRSIRSCSNSHNYRPTRSHRNPKCKSTHSRSSPHKCSCSHQSSRPPNPNLRYISTITGGAHKRSCSPNCQVSCRHRGKPDLALTVRDYCWHILGTCMLACDSLDPDLGFCASCTM